MWDRRLRASLSVCLFSVASALTPACGENLVTGTKMTVPPVRRVPAVVEGATLRLAEDAAIETNEPAYQQRARDTLLPSMFRASMENALRDAGFVVVREKAAPADLEAKIAFNVSDVAGKPRQLYRCKLIAPDGQEVEAVDWAWPQGTFVEEDEVLDFAAHQVASEVAKSPKVFTYFTAHPKGTVPAPAPAPASAAPSAPAPAAPSAPAPAAPSAPAPAAPSAPAPAAPSASPPAP